MDLLSQANTRMHCTTKFKFWVWTKHHGDPKSNMENGENNPSDLNHSENVGWPSKGKTDLCSHRNRSYRMNKSYTAITSFGIEGKHHGSQNNNGNRGTTAL